MKFLAKLLCRSPNKAGADVDVRNEDGRTPLMEAVWNNSNPEIIETLLKAGAMLM